MSINDNQTSSKPKSTNNVPIHPFFAPRKKAASPADAVMEETRNLKRKLPCSSSAKDDHSEESVKLSPETTKVMAAIFQNKSTKQIIAEQRTAELAANREAERTREKERFPVPNHVGVGSNTAETANEPPAKTVKAVFRATDKHKQKMQPLKEAIMEYKWDSDEQRKAHFNSLKRKYDRPDGKGLWINHSATYRVPSVEAIYTRPEWSVLENLASIPRKRLPQFFWTEEEIIAKRGKYHPDIYANKKHNLCSKCNQPSAITSHFTRRCVRCYTMDCERILFALSPESKHSGMMDDPHGAVYFIKKSLHSGLDATAMAKCIEADHKADDTDENVPINRKTGIFGKFYVRERRMKEIKNGAISFTLRSNHSIKTHLEGDVVRKSTQKAADLRQSREAATRLHLKNLDVSDLLEFTEEIHQKGVDWPFKQFLMTVLPWWEAQAEQFPLELPPVTVDDKDMLDLQSRLGICSH